MRTGALSEPWRRRSVAVGLLAAGASRLAMFSPDWKSLSTTMRRTTMSDLKNLIEKDQEDFKTSPWANRPRIPEDPGGSMVSDRMTGVTIALTGGLTKGPVAFSRDQLKHMYKMYKFDPPGQLGPPDPYDPGSFEKMAEAAAFRNMTRHAEADGLRIVAFLARFCGPGEGPLSIIKQGLVELGYDVQLDEEDFE